MRTIGILGGMGPVATGACFDRILRRCQVEHGAVQDGDYPPILLYSMSLKGSDENGIKDETVLAREFLEGVRKLTGAGCDFVIIPCNTAHELIERLRPESSVPILSIVDLTVEELHRRGFRRIAVMASESSLGDGLYQRPLELAGMVGLSPNSEERRALTRMILDIMGGRRTERDRREITRIASRLAREEGAAAALVGCTELSVVQPTGAYSVPAIDALDVLAESAVAEAYGTVLATVHGDVDGSDTKADLPKLV